MNKFLYRVIATSSRHGGRSDTAGTVPAAGAVGLPMAQRMGLMGLTGLAFAALLMAGSVMSGFPAVQAQIIADPGAPGAQQPVIINTANGVPQVNIQTPSAAGVSRNTYSQFDVPKQGAILNNSRTDIQTQLGGWVQHNPNMATGTARVILNEVNSSNPSYLRGYVEVAGDRAQVIVANPSGVTCDGCGFINANRITLTTGTAIMNGGSLDGYLVRGGAVRIDGTGLDAAQADYTDIIARAVQINAGIWSKELRVTAGANQVNAENTQITRMGATDAAPAFGIDVAQLGGMYANKIILVGTEAGVGMRNAGTIGSAVGEIIVTADGRLENSGTLHAQTDIRVAAEALRNSGDMISNTEAVLALHADIDNSQGKIQAERVEISSATGGLNNSNGNIVQSGSQGFDITSASISNTNAGTIATPPPAVTSGTGSGASAPSTGNAAGADNGDAGSSDGNSNSQTVSGTGSNSSAPQIMRQNGNIKVATAILNDAGTISADGVIGINTTALQNDGGKIAIDALDISGAQLSNRGGNIQVARNAVVTVNTLDNRDGVLLAGVNLDAHAVDIDNTGGVMQAAKVTINASNNVDNTRGIFRQTGNTDTVMQVAALLNNQEGSIEAAGSLGLATGSIGGDNGKLTVLGDLRVDSGNSSIKSGVWKIGGNVDMHVAALDNTGGQLLAGNKLSIDSTAVLVNTDGAIEAQGAASTLDISAGSIDNRAGAITNVGSGAATLSARDGISNSGRISSNGNLNLAAATLDNQAGGSVSSAAVMNVAVTQRIDNAGTINSSGAMRFNQASAMLNNSGAILAAGDLSVASAELNNLGGKIGTTKDSAANLLIAAGTVNNQGQLMSDRDLTLTASGDYTQSANASIYAGRDLGMTLTGALTNLGTLGAMRTATLSANSMDNRAGGTVQAENIGITVTTNLDNAGEITANNILDVAAGSINNANAIIGGDVVLRADTLNNSGANALIGATRSMSLWVGNTLNNTGNATIYSSGDMAIAANDVRDANGLVNRTVQVNNQNSTIEAVNNLEIAAVGVKNSRSGVAVTSVTTVDEVRNMAMPSWWHNGPNDPYYNPGSSNFVPHEYYYVNPADILEISQFVTPDGYSIGRVVIKTHANDSAFYRDASGSYGAYGTIKRIDTSDGTRVLYFTGSVSGISNPDQIVDGDDLTNVGASMTWDALPTYSSEYGSCTTDCIRFTTQPGYDDPNSIIIRDTQRLLAPQHDALETRRDAHHVAVEDTLVAGAGTVAEIRAGGNMRIAISQTLDNQYSNIVANGTLLLDGSGANITNLGQTLYRTHSFDGTWYTTGGASVHYDMPSIAEVIGTTQGTIQGAQGVLIVARNFSNVDVSVGSAANIRSDVTLTTGSGGTASIGNTAWQQARGTNQLLLPASGLFQQKESGRYLIETRPQFASQRNWLSSDYLLSAMNVDPATTQKRLGDGFYEQRLVREQLAQLTGRVTGSANDDSQYQQLLNSAVSYAKAWDLRPGVVLTAEQISHLTSDIVWLESQTVTLPDGTTQEVLVPKVYLAHIDADALKSNGVLIAGNSVSIVADNIINKGGLIDAGNADGTGRTILVASNDLSNLGGSIRGDEVALSAGRDLRNETLTVTESYANRQNNGTFTSLSNQATIAAGSQLTINAGRDVTDIGGSISAGVGASKGTGTIDITAGRDIVLASAKTGSTYNAQVDGFVAKSAVIANQGSQLRSGSDMSLVAQRDIGLTAASVNIGTNGSGNGEVIAGREVLVAAAVDESMLDQQKHTKRSSIQANSQSQTVVGSNIAAADGLVVNAGALDNASLTIIGSNVTAGKGLSLAASADVTILAAQESRSSSVDSRSSSRGLLSSRSTTDVDSRSSTTSVSSNVGGNTVSVQAGSDIKVAGSVVAGVSDVSLKAGGNVEITATQNTQQIDKTQERKSAGFAASVGAGVASVGYSKASANSQSSSEIVTQQGSSIVSLNGNTQIQAGEQLRVTASDIGAGNNLTLIAKSIDLSAAQNTSVEHSAQQSSVSGFSAGMTYNPLAAFKSAYQQSASGNPSTSFLGQATKRADATVDGTAAATTAVVVQAGSRSANSNQDYATSTARVSTLTAGNNLTLLATDGSITSQGAAMSAAGDALLIAKNNITLDVARSYETQAQTSIAKGWSVDNRGTLPAGVFNNHGNGDGATTTVTGTSLSVGGTASLSTTQGDITLTAANLVAEGDLSLNAARNLTIQSGQDILANTNRSNDQAIGKVVISDTERFSGYHTEKSQSDNSAVTQVSSNVGSLQGNVTLRAGESYTQTASNVLAANDIDISAKRIDINTADNTGSSAQSSNSLKVGAFARISSPLIDLVNNAQNVARSDGRLQDMQALAAASNVYQIASAVNGKSGTLFKAEVGVGIATADSQDQMRYVQAQGSTIQGGGNVSLTSTEGDISATGASIAAGNTLTLDAARDILLTAGKSSVTSSGDNSNAGVEVGVGYSVGAKTGVYGYVSANIGSGQYDYNAVTYNNTQLSGDTVTLKSQGDTTLKGASVNAGTITADVGGKLSIESLQDTVTQHSEQTSIGGRVQISFGTAWEASGSASQSKANGSSIFVNQQSGLFAGDGGYHVTADTIALKGGAIASSNAGNSDLSSNAITFENLTNKMEYAASTMSVSGSYGSTSNSDKSAGNTSGNGANQGSTPAQGEGSSLSAPTQVTPSQASNGGANPSLLPGMMLNESGSATSTTYATLTDGKITIGGKTTSSAADPGAHTDLATANTAIAALPDLKNVMQEQQAMAAAANTVVATAVQISGDISNSLSQAAKERGDTEAEKSWGPTGDNTRDLKTLTSLLVGALAGQSAGQLAANASAPYLANAIGDYFTQPGNENKTAQVLTHAVLGAALAVANGGNAAAGAGAGAAGELAAQAITKELYPDAYDADGNFHPEKLSARETNTVIALSTAVGALVGGVTGGTTLDASLGGTIAGNAATNNYLKHTEALRITKLLDQRLLGKCDSSCEAEINLLEALDKQRNADLASCTGKNTSSCNANINDVRQAAAEYIRANVHGNLTGITMAYANDRSETLLLAEQTMGDYTVWNIGKGAAESTVDGVKAIGSALYSGFKALTGDPQAQEQIKQAAGAAWIFLQDPNNWPQLFGAMSPAQREQLAQAYETGDGVAVAKAAGEMLLNMPAVGGAGTIKKVTSISNEMIDIEKLAKKANVERVVEVPAGSKGNWDPAINTGTTGSLMPKTAYVLDNGSTYITDASGRVSKVEGTLDLTTMDRNTYQQLCAGKSGCVGDDGGHLIASSLGGAGDSINIVPQASTLNRGDWKAMENYLRDELQAGKTVAVKIDVGYRASGGVRPNYFEVTIIVNGKSTIREFSQ